MKKYVAVAANLLFVITVVAQSGEKPARVAFLHELSLRQRAITAVKPEFPKQALRDRAAGVAVTSVFVDDQGRVSSIRVLQAPHSAIAEELERAVRQWTFKPPVLNGTPIPCKGKLTFYYVIKNSVGRVEDPLKVKQLNLDVDNGRKQLE